MVSLKQHLAAFLLIVSYHLIFTHANISMEARQLAINFAPVVWLHSDEVFYPSSIDFYLQHMEVRDSDESLIQADPSPSGIVSGSGTDGYHINTHEDIGCVHCYENHFFGQTPSEAKVYALVHEFKDNCNTTDISFPTFYPYNYGKDVCIGFDPNGNCLGVVETFGNHVSDWEMSSIRFQNGQPTDMYLAVHSFGAYYGWNATSRTYNFYRGEPMHQQMMQQGNNKSEVKYPPTIFLDNGNHPAVYSANGSHGTWAAEGKHTYFNFVIHLDDFTERGIAWSTWANMDLIEVGATEEELENQGLSWINFGGKWGNIRKLDCSLEPLVGECGLMSGVAGPRKYFAGPFPNPPLSCAKMRI